MLSRSNENVRRCEIILRVDVELLSLLTLLDARAQCTWSVMYFIQFWHMSRVIVYKSLMKNAVIGDVPSVESAGTVYTCQYCLSGHILSRDCGKRMWIEACSPCSYINNICFVSIIYAKMCYNWLQRTIKAGGERALKWDRVPPL